MSRSTSASRTVVSPRSSAASSADAASYDAQGLLACPGLIESHIHLDKSRIIDRCAPQERAKLSPVFGVTPVKKTMTVEDVYARAKATLEECLKHGATRMRTQVEVDPGIGLRGFEGVAALIDEYRWAIDIEICVFPQEGLISYPGTEELVIEGLKRGAKLIGGAPRYDKDGAGQIRRIFELAREFDVDIDMHLDVGPSAEHMDIDLVRELTDKYRRGGRVVVGHMAKLSLLPPDRFAALARSLADSGIAVTVLPATDLFLMGRDQDHAVRRGVADANVLCEHGVQCSLSTNNVLNPATPYGDCSLMRIANLYANVMFLDRPAELRRCFEMLTTRSARAAEFQGLRLRGRQPGRCRHSERAARRSRRWPRSPSRSPPSRTAGRQWPGACRGCCGPEGGSHVSLAWREPKIIVIPGPAEGRSPESRAACNALVALDCGFAFAPGNDRKLCRGWKKKKRSCPPHNLLNSAPVSVSGHYVFLYQTLRPRPPARAARPWVRRRRNCAAMAGRCARWRSRPTASRLSPAASTPPLSAGRSPATSPSRSCASTTAR